MTNTGNVTAAGRLVVHVTLTSGDTAGPVRAVVRRVAVRAGAAVRVRLPVRLSAGTWTASAAVDLGDVTASAVGTPFAVG